jgi:hypothetical protein
VFQASATARVIPQKCGSDICILEKSAQAAAGCLSVGPKPSEKVWVKHQYARPNRSTPGAARRELAPMGSAVQPWRLFLAMRVLAFLRDKPASVVPQRAIAPWRPLSLRF